MEEKIQKINTDGEILVPKISLDNEEDNSNVHKEGSVRKKENNCFNFNDLSVIIRARFINILLFGNKLQGNVRNPRGQVVL